MVIDASAQHGTEAPLPVKLLQQMATASVAARAVPGMGLVLGTDTAGDRTHGSPRFWDFSGPAHLLRDQNAGKAFLQNKQNHRTMPAPLHAACPPP